MAVWIFPAVWRNLRSALALLTSSSSLFGGGGGGGSVDFDRDRFLAFVVAAIVLNSLNNTSVFRCVRFLRRVFSSFLHSWIELILGCFFTFFLIFLATSFFFLMLIEIFSWALFLRHVRKNFQLINYYNTTMASSLTFSASVGQQQKVFSVNKNASSKKRVSVQTKAASFVRFCSITFSLFLCLYNLSHFSDLFYFFFLSANLFNLSTRITTNRKKRAKRTDARHSQPRSPAKA